MRFGASCLAIAASLAVGATVTSCGGSGKGAAKPMVLVSFQLVDRALNPSFPTGVQALPRNAQIIFQFSELVDPTSVNDPDDRDPLRAPVPVDPEGRVPGGRLRVISTPRSRARARRTRSASTP
jgi:hypothetical protein